MGRTAEWEGKNTQGAGKLARPVWSSEKLGITSKVYLLLPILKVVRDWFVELLSQIRGVLILSRWTIFQFFILGFLIMVMSLVELFSGLFGLTEFPFLPVTFILLVIICFYLLFLFENKKENHIFSSSLWLKMPMLTGILGAISATLFIIGVEFFPLFD
ncbi:hypothetical protein EPH95_14700 [Salicibibacter halophilus]|uniref:Uncharacterized protein n=1 Tax=Salicibibacter halophilus TaxID=2502791 RepID=A0A514LM00_9BACI|nr:hypothetical protein [Salicibibacter halophilus]QDI92281.1 hypothetical protein EPH95_14700 [Salicibibacter halophilus]